MEHDILKNKKSKILDSISAYIGSYIDESKLREDLLKQKYKSDAVWEILHLEEIEESLRKGDKRKFEEQIFQIPDELHQKELIKEAIKSIQSAMTLDIKTLGNITYVILGLENQILSKKFAQNELESSLKKLLKNKDAQYITLDEISGEGIGKLLKKMNNNNIRNALMSVLDDTLVEGIKTKEEE